MSEIEADRIYRTPGQLIMALLDERGWTQRVLAIVLKVDETGLNKIVAGKRPMDAGLALALGEVFDVEPERFLELQKRFDLAQARIVSRPDPNRATRATLFGDLPISDMIRRGWIQAKDVRDIAEVEKSLKKFFRVSSLDEIEVLPHAAKRTRVNTPATPTQLVWIKRVKDIAEDMLVARHSTQSGRVAVEKLRSLLIAPEETRKVPRILAECGIRFVIVESLPSAKIDGVCLWLGNDSPVIGMSFRFDRIDNFWFVLRHELEHVIREHGKVAAMLDTELEGSRAGVGPDLAEEERQANEAAQDFCVPRAKMDSFIARKAPVFADRDILGFAKTIGVHPGIVAGQIRRRTNKYDRLSTYLVKVRANITPSAVVDGWGDVAPVGF